MPHPSWHGTVTVTRSGVAFTPPCPEHEAAVLTAILQTSAGSDAPPDLTGEALLAILTDDLYESILRDESDPALHAQARQALSEGYTAVRSVFAIGVDGLLCTQEVAYRTGETWRDLFATPLNDQALESLTHHSLHRVHRQAGCAHLEVHPGPLVSADVSLYRVHQALPLPALQHLTGPVALTTLGQVKSFTRLPQSLLPALSFPPQWVETNLGPATTRAMQANRGPLVRIAQHVLDLTPDESGLAVPPATAAVRCVTTCASAPMRDGVGCTVLWQAWQPVNAQGHALAPLQTWTDPDTPSGHQAAQAVYTDMLAFLAAAPDVPPTHRTLQWEPVTDHRHAIAREHESHRTLEARLTGHVQALNVQYPEVHKRLPDLHARGSFPAHTFVPFGDVARLMAERHDLLDPQVQWDLVSFMTVGTWRVTRGVYRLDETLLNALWNDTAPPDELPLDQLQHLPEWSVYVPLPGRTTPEGLPIHGVFATYTPEQIILTLDQVDGQLHHELLDTSAGSLQAAVRRQSEGTLPADLRGTVAGTRLGQAEFLGNVLNVLLYLCTADVDLPARPAPRRNVGKARGGGLTGQVTTWDVGIRLGAALRAAQTQAGERAGDGKPTLMTVRPHIRRAHFHRFRTGPLDLGDARPLRLRWLPPIPVKLDLSEEDFPVVVRPVEA